MGSQAMDNRFYQFCLLDVVRDSTLTLAFVPNMSSPINKTCWYYLRQRIQSRQRSLRKLSHLLIRLTWLPSSLFAFVPQFEAFAKDVCFYNSTRRTPLFSPKGPLSLVFGARLNIKTCGSYELPVFKWSSSCSCHLTSFRIPNGERNESSQGHIEG